MTKPTTKDELIALLSDILARIKADDSYEGSVEWEFPADDDPPGTDFRAAATYRVGNSMGQGGYVIWGDQ